MAENELEKAVKEINKDIDTIKTLEEKIDSLCPSSKDKVVDLQKVQVLDNYFSSWFNFLGAIAAGGLILLITVSTTIYYTLSVIGGFIGFGISAVSGVYIILEMKKNHKRNIEKINKLIVRIEKGESLPSISELEL